MNAKGISGKWGALVYAMIAAGSATFAVFAGTNMIDFKAGGIAGGLAFFASLAASLRRGDGI